MIATFIGDKIINEVGARAKIYHLTVPVMYECCDENGDRTTCYAQYVRVSAVGARYGSPETYIFPSDRAGNALSWLKLGGSLEGELDHNRALQNAGYIVREN
jgi:hypothetical protein